MKAKEEKETENKDLLEAMKDALDNKVKEVRISSRLSDDPVCIVADEGVSLDMERYMASDPIGKAQNIKATKILEINPDHPIFNKLQEVYKKDPEKLKEFSSVLYNQALLIQGLSIENPVEYAKQITDIMLKTK